MTASRKPGEKPIVSVTTADEGKTRAEVQVAGKPASWVVSTPQTIHLGAALVPIAYIGPIETAEGWRGLGYARLAIEASLQA